MTESPIQSTSASIRVASPPGPRLAVPFHSSPNLPEILSHLNVSLVVSTYQAGKVLCLGSHKGELKIVAIIVNAVNDKPVAADDSYSVDEDMVLNVAGPGQLVNDTDVDGDPLTAVGYYSASHGTVNIHTDGSFSYTPAANFFGSDSFIYKI